MAKRDANQMGFCAVLPEPGCVGAAEIVRRGRGEREVLLQGALVGVAESSEGLIRGLRLNAESDFGFVWNANAVRVLVESVVTPDVDVT